MQTSEVSGAMSREGSRSEAEVAAQHAREVAAGERFEFGKNWLAFLSTLDEERIQTAVESLQRMLGVTSLEGKTFVDVGSGSGLFSLAARRLGARVTSFDYDPSSVACTRELQTRFFRDDPNWRVEAGSALDKEYVSSLGTFDVVYSWGVLHHTGQLWRAVENVRAMVKPGGQLFLALYNDQGAISRRWLRVKQWYCKGGIRRIIVATALYTYWGVRTVLSDLRHGHGPLHTFSTYKKKRGMSMTHDWKDWLGGLPCEVSMPEEVILPLHREGFVLSNLVTQGGTMGCVEYVFRLQPPPEIS